MQPDHIDCACVIHGDLYSWNYVDNLYRMILRNTNHPVRFHVFTEPDRSVPDDMIKHDLKIWPGVTGRKKAWWYKMQLFNPKSGLGQLLYFDLDVVLTGNIDWILSLRRDYFWALKDFKYLWKPAWQGINSSVMWWDVQEFAHVWQNFNSRQLSAVMRQYAGDQDFLSDAIDPDRRRFMDPDLVKSWRWQILDGGMDMRTRSYRRPGAGGVMLPGISMMIFHGSPKPHEIQDPLVMQHWDP